MKIQQVIMLASRFLAGSHVRAACLAGALAVFIYQMVNTGFSTPVWAATPNASAKHSSLPPADPALRAKVAKGYGQLPLSFEPNRGQTDPRVQFLSRGRGYQIFLTPKETVLSLRKSTVGSRQSADGNSKIENRKSAPAPSAQSQAPEVLRMRLLGASQTAALEGAEKLPGISNYFIGKDATQWRTNIPNFRRVVAKQVYPGVDLVYYGQGRELEYDFVVAPGASPQAIRFALETGNSKLENGDWEIDPNGDMVVSLDGGEVRFHKPLVYQEESAVGSRQSAGENQLPPIGSNLQSTIGNRQFIEGRYVLLADNRVGFEVGAYDKSRPLVIDPVLSYSTYLGGIELDAANAIAISSDGAAFIAGETDSANFPTAHPLQPNAGGPFDFPDDAFVAKISPDGSTLYYSTYLGGNLDDRANGIAVDSFGAAYVTGTTISADFPASIGAADPNCGNDGKCDKQADLVASDAFATKLNSEGSAIVYSTFIGHRGFLVSAGPPPVFSGANDRGFAIAVDLNGIAYVVGTTDASDEFGPFSGAGNDAFLAKISATGSSFLFFATPGQDAADFGGTLEDQALGVAVEKFSAIAYLTGITYSPNYPGCVLAGDADALIMKIDTKLPVISSIVYSRCMGGTNRDQGQGIAVDAANNAYITGVTNSVNFPTTAGVIKPACTSEGDVFVSKFNTTPALVYSTCVGGSGADSGASIALDTATNVYVTGFTNSAVDFPVPGTPTTSFQEFYGGGNTDAFVLKMDPTATSLIYATYLGGSNAEDGRGIAVDKNGTAYVTGQTCSVDFQTVRPLQQFPGGNCDAFIAKVQVGPGFTLSAATLNFGPQAVGTPSQPQTITLTSKGDSGVTVSSISVTGDFSLTENCTTAPLAVDATCTIDVVFQPTTLDPKGGTITILSDSLSSPDTVNLAGGGSNAAGGFLLDADPTSQIISAGGDASSTLTLTPTSGFSGNVTLACSGLPQQATCSISPATLTVTGTGAQSSVLTVHTTARVMAPPAPGPGDFLPHTGLRWAPWLAALLALAMFAASRRQRAVMVLAAMMVVTIFWTACGAGGTTVGSPRGTPAGNYSVTVTATSGSTSRSVAIAVRVN